MNSNDASNLGIVSVMCACICLCIALIFGSTCTRDIEAISAGYTQTVDPNTNKIIWVAPTNPKIEK